jgi:hypothetical protein
MSDKTSEVVELNAGRRLLDYWMNAGDISLRPGATRSSIGSFERSNHVLLPRDLREYFECADGFDQETNYHDERGFNFWPLNKLTPVSRFERGHFHFEGDSGYFLFCDYLDFSWGYAISLNGGRNEVVLVGTNDGKPRHVADSFSEFVDAYFSDDDHLYA